MGVPSFYRWLVDRYPEVVVNAVEETEEIIDGVYRPIDLLKDNPNKMEFHNLYLDMNGIIHPCFHPDDQMSSPTSYEEIFRSMFEYIDRLFSIVRPRRLLYMAVDGVAPRAKMNQQRSRRFRAAKDAEVAEALEEKLRREFEREGKSVLPRQESEVEDSNVITPGTEFMDALLKALEYYVRLRLNYDPGWKNIKVIISDANVPGEGEHKLMQFIRLQRNLPGYDPNTRHCLYGLDADLIMLALATHEIHFSIIREDVIKVENRANCRSPHDIKAETRARKNYQFLNVWTLREYLEIDLTISDPPFRIDFERLIDDFIFICFFAGNDFLPHLPSIEIHERGIDLLISVYKGEFKNMGGYITDVNKIKEKKAAYIKLSRVERFILAVGSYEEKIFKKRSILRKRLLDRIMREKLEAMHVDDSDNFHEGLEYGESNRKGGCCMLPNKDRVSKPSEISHSNVIENTKELKSKVKELIRQSSDLLKDDALVKDKVKFDTPGWRMRYYKEKFCAEDPAEVNALRKKIVQNYTEGLCWVFHYYFAGVCSWGWFYKYHYGPFASDLKGLASSEIRFQLGSPFKPFTQLMAVLPARSAHALPECFQNLMTSAMSPLNDFYPNDFEVDTDGKRYSWQGVAKLKFIEEDRLLREIKKVENELKDEELKRNSVRSERIFLRVCHSLGPHIVSLYACKVISQINIDCQASGGMNGFLLPCDEGSIAPNFWSPIKGMEDIMDDQVLNAKYKDPEFHQHIPTPPENVSFPNKEIKDDIVDKPLWHEEEGRRPFGNQNNSRNWGGRGRGRGRGAPSSSDPNADSSLQSRGFRGRGKGRGSSIGVGVKIVNNFVSRGSAATNWIGRGRSIHPTSSDWNMGYVRPAGNGGFRGRGRDGRLADGYSSSQNRGFSRGIPARNDGFWQPTGRGNQRRFEINEDGQIS